MDSDISDSSFVAASRSALDDSSFSVSVCLSCLRLLTSALLRAMDSSKLSLNDLCSSMSASADSLRSFLVARSIFACSILDLSSLYSGPILEAISSSTALMSISVPALRASISMRDCLPSSIFFEMRSTCPCTDSSFDCSICSLLWVYWALAISRALCALMYASASCLSRASLSTWWESSSMMMLMRSRLTSASCLSLRARSMSASKLAMPEMASMMRLLSMDPIWTMRVTSPCWTRLYPSALILALVRRVSNSDMVDLRSLTKKYEL